METLLANAVGSVRQVRRHGRDYLVVPMVMGQEQVLHGSGGPLYYPLEEWTHSVDAWNGMPIVVNHPRLDGQYVSARRPDIIASHGIGTVYESKVDGRLLAEGWFDVEDTRRVDARILNRLLARQPIELSTGLTAEYEEHEERHCPRTGLTYNRTARNYQPDHLAVLPDGKGACSMAHGCGVLVNQEEEPQEASGAVTSVEEPLPEADEALLGLVTNQPSHDDIRSRLCALIAEKYGSMKMAGDAYDQPMMPLVEAVFDKYLIFSLGGDLYRQGYKVDLRTDSVELLPETPTEVSLVSQYRPIKNELGAEPVLTVNPKGEWTPPDAGDAPDEIKRILRAVYSAYRDRHPAENASVKAKGAQIAWGAVHKAGWKKDKNGKWRKKMPHANEETPPAVLGSEVGSPDGPPSLDSGEVMTVKLTPERKQAIVKGLLANCNCAQDVPWKGKTEAELNALSDDGLATMEQFNAFLGNAKPPQQPTQPSLPAGLDMNALAAMVANQLRQPTQQPNQPTTNQTPPVAQPVPRTQTAEEFVSSMWPGMTLPQVQSAVRNAMEVEQRERANLIGALTFNIAPEHKTAAENVYGRMGMEELKALVAALPPREEQHAPTVNFFGSVGAPTNSLIQEEPLLAPRYDFRPANGRAG